MQGGKNLIMGLWTRGTFKGLEPFLGSLRCTTFDGDVCNFVADLAPETVDALLAHGVIVERADRLSTPAMNGQSSRYFNYLEFLTRHADRYSHVMLSDLRDVVFQSDPFARPLPAELVFAQERCVLGRSPVNRQWVLELYGQAITDNLRDCSVS